MLELNLHFTLFVFCKIFIVTIKSYLFNLWKEKETNINIFDIEGQDIYINKHINIYYTQTHLYYYIIKNTNKSNKN